ncbi:MAG: DedA family protein [Phycisphaerae bacterium]|nr:DedA family protein [Phycisphaerae bacterium]
MIESLTPFLEHWSYTGLILVLLACGLGLPLPEDVPLVISGWLVHRGYADLYLMMAAGMFGVLAGDSILFTFGRRFGERIVELPLLRRMVTQARLDWAERQFAKRGAIIVFAARFMPGARPVLFMTAGIFRVSYLKFLAIDGFAALISVPVWIYLGARFGEAAETYLGNVKYAQYVVFGTLGAILIAWFFWERHQHQKRRQEELARALTHPPRAHPEAPAEHVSLPAQPAAAEPKIVTPAVRPSRAEPRPTVAR